MEEEFGWLELGQWSRREVFDRKYFIVIYFEDHDHFRNVRLMSGVA